MNGFDTNYFMYCEDTDLCLRVKRRNYKVYGIPCEMVHRFGGSSSQVLEKRIRYSRDSVNKYMKKHFRKHQYILGYMVVLLNILLKMSLCFLLSILKFWRFKYFWIRGKGYYNALYMKSPNYARVHKALTIRRGI